MERGGMVSYVHVCSSIVFVALVSSFGTLSFARSSTMDDKLIEKLCAKSTNPSFCANALRSDPRSAIADTVTFEQIAIDLTKANATDTWHFVSLNKGESKDPKLKAAFGFCSPNYADIIITTDDAKKSLQARDFFSVDTAGQSIMESTDECNKQFTDPNPMADRNQAVKLLGETIALIAEVLISG